MRAILDCAKEGVLSSTRVLLLPAAYTCAEDFVRAGFARAARARNIPVDLHFVELKLQHLTDRSVLRRLRHEIILPARAAGCRSIWLGGVSLGGFIAIAYAERYSHEIDGLCLLAPYLGNHIVISEIERANGVSDWSPGTLADDDDERRVWRFIKEHSARAEHDAAAEHHAATERCAPREHGARGDHGPRRMPVHLGFGETDRFAGSHRLMAAALSPESIDVVPGGHEWPTWLRLWENFLAKRFPSSEAMT